MKRSYKLWISFIFFAVLLARLDRLFFKQNACFCVDFIQRSGGATAACPLPTAELDDILSQPFTYLSRGLHCYAFLSQDRTTVLKFHRIPSPERKSAWLRQKRRTRFAYFMGNYAACYTDLQKETGCLWLHLWPSAAFRKPVTLIDKTGNRYSVDLNDTACILQSAAELVYPTLLRCDRNRAKTIVTHIVELLASSYSKGYVQADPVVEKNFGLLSDRAIFIDFGDVVKQESGHSLADYLKEATFSLRCWLQGNRMDLLEHFDAELARSS